MPYLIYPELLEAIRARDSAKVMELLDGGNLILELKGRQALYYAAYYGRIEMVRSLLENGADVDGPNNIGYRPLAGAAAVGKLDIVEFLLDRGATIDARNNYDRTALMVVCRECRIPRNQPVIVRLLLERGADITLTDWKEETVLMAAASGGNVEVFQAIHFETWDLDVQDEEGNTALHHAAEYGQTEAIEALLAAGANPTIRNKKGQTPYEAGLAIRPDEPFAALKSTHA